MKVNNKKIKSYVLLLYSILSVLFITFLVLKLIHIPVFDEFSFLTSLLFLSLFLFLLLSLLLYIRGYQHFEYDSDGEALNFKNTEIILTELFPNLKKSAEFPKRKLVSYKIMNGFFTKKLHLTVRSRKSKQGFTKLKYNITYLKRSEIKRLKISLDNVLETNKITVKEYNT